MKFRQFISVAAAATLAVGTVSCGDSSSSVSSRVKRILKFLDKGEYDEASAYVGEHSLNEKERAELGPELQKRVDDAIAAYSDGSGDYDTAHGLISCAQRMDLPDLIVPLAEASTKLDKLYDSNSAFDLGKQYYNDGNYTYALQYFDRVAEESVHHEEAVKLRDECVGSFRSEMEKQIKGYSQSGDYEGALRYLESQRYSYSESPSVTEILDDLIAETGVNGVLGEAQKLLDQGDLSGALDRVEKFEDDHNITDARLDDFSKKAKDEYLETVLKKAEELYNQQNYLSALKMIDNAQEILTDSRLDALEEKINAVKPTYLSEVYLTNSRGYKLIDSGDELRDTIGNTYPVGNLFLTDGYDCYGEYNLGYRYNHLSGTIAVENSSSNGSAVLRIIGDGVTLYSVNLKRAMTPTAFDVDVSSVNWLKITVSDAKDGSAKAILADCKFNDGSAQQTTTVTTTGTTGGNADTEETTTTTASAEE